MDLERARLLLGGAARAEALLRRSKEEEERKRRAEEASTASSHPPAVPLEATATAESTRKRLPEEAPAPVLSPPAGGSLLQGFAAFAIRPATGGFGGTTVGAPTSASAGDALPGPTRTSAGATEPRKKLKISRSTPEEQVSREIVDQFKTELKETEASKKKKILTTAAIVKKKDAEDLKQAEVQKQAKLFADLAKDRADEEARRKRLAEQAAAKERLIKEQETAALLFLQFQKELGQKGPQQLLEVGMPSAVAIQKSPLGKTQEGSVGLLSADAGTTLQAAELVKKTASNLGSDESQDISKYLCTSEERATNQEEGPDPSAAMITTQQVGSSAIEARVEAVKSGMALASHLSGHQLPQQEVIPGESVATEGDRAQKEKGKRPIEPIETPQQEVCRRESVVAAEQPQLRSLVIAPEGPEPCTTPIRESVFLRAVAEAGAIGVITPEELPLADATGAPLFTTPQLRFVMSLMEKFLELRLTGNIPVDEYTKAVHQLFHSHRDLFWFCEHFATAQQKLIGGVKGVETTGREVLARSALLRRIDENLDQVKKSLKDAEADIVKLKEDSEGRGKELHQLNVDTDHLEATYAAVLKGSDKTAEDLDNFKKDYERDLALTNAKLAEFEEFKKRICLEEQLRDTTAIQKANLEGFQRCLHEIAIRGAFSWTLTRDESFMQLIPDQQSFYQTVQKGETMRKQREEQKMEELRKQKEDQREKDREQLRLQEERRKSKEPASSSKCTHEARPKPPCCQRK